MGALKQAASLFVVGLGLGWLMGLSASPVAGIVLTSILAIVAGLVGALAGMGAGSQPPHKAGGSQDSKGESFTYFPSRHVNPTPLALLILGLVSGSYVGVQFRTDDRLGLDPDVVIRRWRGDGLDEKYIRKRLFDSLYPAGSDTPKQGKSGQEQGSKEAADSPPTSPANSSQGVLFSLPHEECAELRSLEGKRLRQAMVAGSDRRIRSFAARARDDADLKAAVEELLCAEPG